MSFFCRLSGRHYWCTPHRSADHRLVQVCYECGAERPARELLDDLAPERLNHSLASARNQMARASAALIDDSEKRDQEAAHGRPRKFALVK